MRNYTSKLKRPELTVEQKRLFNSLVSENYAQFKNTTSFFAKGMQDREDLLHDALLKAYKSFYLFDPKTNFVAWVNMIIRNTAINKYRWKKRQPFKADMETAEVYLTDPESKDISEIDHFHDEISEALSDLSLDFRTVILMHDVYSFAYKDISVALNIPLGTVMSRLHRARCALRLKLKDVNREDLL